MSKIMKSNTSVMIVINTQLWNDFQVSNDSAAESSVHVFDCSSNMSTSISQSVQFGEYPGLISDHIWCSPVSAEFLLKPTQSA